MKWDFAQHVSDWVMKRNRNFFIVCVGPPGSGKSWVMLSIAAMVEAKIKRKFNVAHVCFTGSTFMKLLNNKEEIKRGMVLGLDEAGVAIASREYYSIINRALDAVFQTFRYRNLVIIATVPDLSFIDSHIRKMINVIIETDHDSVNEFNKKTTVKLKFVINQPVQGVIKFPFPQITTRGGEVIKIVSMDIPAPPKEMAHKYEKLHQDFKEKLAKRKAMEIEKSESKILGPVNPKDIVSHILKFKKRYLRRKGKYRYIDAELVAALMPCGLRAAITAKKMAEYKLGLLRKL